MRAQLAKLKNYYAIIFAIFFLILDLGGYCQAVTSLFILVYIIRNGNRISISNSNSICNNNNNVFATPEM